MTIISSSLLHMISNQQDLQVLVICHSNQSRAGHLEFIKAWCEMLHTMQKKEKNIPKYFVLFSHSNI